MQQASVNESRTIFVAGLPLELSVEALAEVFAPCGSITQSMLSGEEGTSRYAFIEFESAEAARAACAMNGTKLKDSDAVLHVVLSHTPLSGPTNPNTTQQPRDILTLGDRMVHVACIDQRLAEPHIRKLFGLCGTIVNMLVVGEGTKRVALIEFETPQAASAAHGLTGTAVGNTIIRVVPAKLVLSWLRPQQLPPQLRQSHPPQSRGRRYRRHHPAE